MKLWTIVAALPALNLGVILLGVVVLAILILFIRNVRVVPQAMAFVIERLGTYKMTWQTGIHAKMPFLDRIERRISLKERVADFPPQPVITRDNVTMQIDTVVFYQIVDPVLYCYGIENPISAIENLTATTLRNVIGDLELDETLTSRDTINTRMRLTLAEAMKAEREKRENILISEGKKEALIRVAEGEKEAAILRAEGKKEQAIRESEGNAQAILTIQEATARGLKMIKDVGANEALIALKSLETMEVVANGRATKIIIPSNLQSLAGLAVSVKELMSDSNIDMTEQVEEVVTYRS